jgi:hypothetical protein
MDRLDILPIEMRYRLYDQLNLADLLALTNAYPMINHEINWTKELERRFGKSVVFTLRRSMPRLSVRERATVLACVIEAFRQFLDDRELNVYGRSITVMAGQFVDRIGMIDDSTFVGLIADILFVSDGEASYRDLYSVVRQSSDWDEAKRFVEQVASCFGDNIRVDDVEVVTGRGAGMRIRQDVSITFI